MAITVEQLRAKLIEKEKSKERNSSGSFGDNASYPFWKIPDNSTATLRFLPDGDPDNVFFWVEKQNIKLKFQGVIGTPEAHDKEITISVPCVEMWGQSCPILAETRPWWKDPAKENLARQYWKKKTFIFQGFVVNSPFEEESVPENPIRRFVINPSIFEIIKNSLMNPEMEDMPVDYDGGRDFKLTKHKKGEFANYTTSQWSFKPRSLTEVERIAIEQHGLFNLKDYMGRKPDSEELSMIVAMFHDSLAGRPFDLQAYGKYYRPYGMQAPAAATPEVGATTDTAVVESDVVEAEASFAAAPAPVTTTTAPASGGGKPNAHEILERIKNRTAAAR